MAATLSVREPGRTGVDLASRVSSLGREARRVRDQLARVARVVVGEPEPGSVGPALALAYPDRVAQRRPGPPGRFRLANGRGAVLDGLDPLAAEPWLAVAELDDAGAEARIRSAAALDGDLLESLFADRLVETVECGLDRRTGTVAERRVLRLGELILRERAEESPDPERAAHVLLAHVRAEGLAVLPWTSGARQLQARVALLQRLEPDAWPDLGDAALLGTLEEWLLPYLVGKRRLAELGDLDLEAILAARLDQRQRREVDRLAPTHLTVPSGSRVAVDYGQDPPVVAVKLQEMFGCVDTPVVTGGRVPVVLHLLSPARRPVAVTRDLAGFWRETYAQVRKELRGRYPKHPWPDDPLAAAPTARTKPRR